MVLLCEDKQHRAFVTRLIHRLGWKPRDLRIEQSPTGRGSAEHYVRNRFPRELQWLRSKGVERVYLIVMVDGDAAGVSKRKASLSAACHQLGVPPPGDADNVVICVPSWNIETWLAYLGGKTVDETNANTPKWTDPAIANRWSTNSLKCAATEPFVSRPLHLWKRLARATAACSPAEVLYLPTSPEKGISEQNWSYGASRRPAATDH